MSSWLLTYDGFDPTQEGLREALCTLGNGVFATRGAAPEASADDVHYPGTYIAGVYNRLDTEIAGRTITNEDLVNCPNWLPVTFRIDGGDPFGLQRVEILDHRQELDLRRGLLTRLVRFTDPQGRTTRLAQRRIVHMENPRLAAIETTIAPEDWSGRIEVTSALDGRVRNTGVPRYRDLADHHLEARGEGTLGDDIVWLVVETNTSHVRIAQAARTRLLVDGHQIDAHLRSRIEEGYVAHITELDVTAGDAVTIEKTCAVVTSRDRAIASPEIEAEKQVTRAPDFDDLLERHVLAWEQLWDRFDIELGGSEEPELILHLHIFHLLQTVSPNTIGHDVGVPARGLHGEAYRGHVFWDELFILPFLNLRLPEISRELLTYRYDRLPEARWAAAQAGYGGAMYPWQSGSDGREESQEVHLNPKSGRWIPDNSHLQKHINAAIAYNVCRYVDATDDRQFLAYMGAEMVCEIARFWSSIATYDRSLDRYRIRGVMGPDEYHDAYPHADTAGLDDNAYTNVMAVWCLRQAFAILEQLHDHRSDELRTRLGIDAEELDRWGDISRKMRIPFHGDGIISQFEGYDDLEEFDWEDYRARYGEIMRLDRILEAEDDTPNRYKASKQADVLMLFYLFDAETLQALFERLGYAWDDGLIPRNIDYYLQRTSHGSTLSSVVHSWVLSRADREASWEFFRRALYSDVADIQGGTTPEGIHLGAMAGTIDLAQRCYAGLGLRDGALELNPTLPKELERLRFHVRYREHWVEVDIGPDEARLSTRPDAAFPLRVVLPTHTAEIAPGETRTFSL